MQSLQLRTRIEAQLLGEPVADVGVAVQRVRPASGQVRRTHGGGHERFGHRVLAHQLDQRADHRLRVAQAHLRLRPLAERVQPLLVQRVPGLRRPPAG